MVEVSAPQMEYRYLGNSGLKVSILSYGNMASVWTEDSQKLTTEIVKKCLDYGINFFDTAEAYGKGAAEKLLGQAFKDLNVKREEIVVATKLFWMLDSGVNGFGLSRKHIIEGTKNSLKRLQLDYVDIMYAHRHDYETPLEETCKAFSWIVDKGYSLYWGTSEWPVDMIIEALKICKELNLNPPIVDQVQYNMLMRENFEKTLSGLFQRHKYGTAVWSPLAQGVLTGRYNDGTIPDDSRFKKWESQAQVDRIYGMYMAPSKREKTLKILQGIGEAAKDLGVTQCQLALAWCLVNHDVSSLILGFSKIEQLDENIKCLELYKRWNQEIEDKILKVLDNDPEILMNMRTLQPMPQRRQAASKFQ